jgi:hypothetical protein
MSDVSRAWPRIETPFAPTDGARFCEEKDRDRYGRIVAICRASGEDLGAIMVREGMAWVFTRYSYDYVDQEAKAKTERLGVHGHGCQPAWEWRAQQRARAGLRGEMPPAVEFAGVAASPPGRQQHTRHIFSDPQYVSDTVVRYKDQEGSGLVGILGDTGHDEQWSSAEAFSGRGG